MFHKSSSKLLYSTKNHTRKSTGALLSQANPISKNSSILTPNFSLVSSTFKNTNAFSSAAAGRRLYSTEKNDDAAKQQQQQEETNNTEKIDVVEEVEQKNPEQAQNSFNDANSSGLFTGGLSEAAQKEMEQLQQQTQEEPLPEQEEEIDASTDHGYSQMTQEELYDFLPKQDRETLFEIAQYYNLPDVSKKTPPHHLRDLLMHYKVQPEDPIFKHVKKIQVPAVVPKGAYKKKYWGRQWVYDPEEARRWPTVKFILRDVKSSVKKMHITAEFIKGLQLKEAIDQLILWRKKTNLLTANFLWSCMKISEHNYSFVQDDILIRDVEIQKQPYLKRVRYHGKAKMGVMHKRKCNVIITLCEVPRQSPDQKIGRYGWRPETWRKFEETYPEIIAQMEEREELERQASMRWRQRVAELSEGEQREERQKHVEKYKQYFKENHKFLSFDLVEEPQQQV